VRITLDPVRASLRLLPERRPQSPLHELSNGPLDTAVAGMRAKLRVLNQRKTQRISHRSVPTFDKVASALPGAAEALSTGAAQYRDQLVGDDLRREDRIQATALIDQ
jgi:hypothetical protein